MVHLKAILLSVGTLGFSECRQTTPQLEACAVVRLRAAVVFNVIASVDHNDMLSQQVSTELLLVQSSMTVPQDDSIPCVPQVPRLRYLQLESVDTLGCPAGPAPRPCGSARTAALSISACVCVRCL
jgi:hypothetical protein